MPSHEMLNRKRSQALRKRTCGARERGNEAGLADAGRALQQHCAAELQRTQQAQRVSRGRGRSKVKRGASALALGPPRYKKWRDAPQGACAAIMRFQNSGILPR